MRWQLKATGIGWPGSLVVYMMCVESAHHYLIFFYSGPRLFCFIADLLRPRLVEVVGAIGTTSGAYSHNWHSAWLGFETGIFCCWAKPLSYLPALDTSNHPKVRIDASSPGISEWGKWTYLVEVVHLSSEAVLSWATRIPVTDRRSRMVTLLHWEQQRYSCGKIINCHMHEAMPTQNHIK